MAFSTLASFANDGRAALINLVASSSWGTVEQALASLSVFAHPDAVTAVGNRAVFRAVRLCAHRRTIQHVEPHGPIYCDDNAVPQQVFCWVTHSVLRDIS